MITVWVGTGESQLPLRLHLSNTSITGEIAVCSMHTGLECLKLLYYNKVDTTQKTNDVT